MVDVLDWATKHPRGYHGYFGHGLPSVSQSRLAGIESSIRARGIDPYQEPLPLSTVKASEFRHQLDEHYPLKSYEQGSLNSYTGFDFLDINTALRNGDPEFDEQPYQAGDLRKAFKPIPRTMTLVRTIDPGAVADRLAKLEPGDVIADKAFTSTSIRPRPGQHAVRLNIVAPKGIPSLWAGDRGYFPVEDEMLLAPGQPLLVMRKIDRPDGVDLWLVPVRQRKRPR